MQAKKHFGQNFLKDLFVLDRIVQVSTELLQGQKLIEIGVGLGDLSERLLSISNLTTYEIDADLCSFVLRKFSSCSFTNTFSLVHCDVLSIPFDIDSSSSLLKERDVERIPNTTMNDNINKIESKRGWLADEAYILVSNLPYNIATHVVLNLLRDPLCEGFVVMTQKEVALKFCADTLSSNFCALSVIAQSAGEMTLLFDVSKESFEPMPKVTSSVFMHKKFHNFTHIESDFESMLKMAFSYPRKKLYNNLLPFFQKHRQEYLLDTIFTRESIASSARPHQISTQKYHLIYNTLKDTYERDKQENKFSKTTRRSPTKKTI